MNLDFRLGKVLILKVNGGCKKMIECCGILVEIYLFVFIVEFD